MQHVIEVLVNWVMPIGFPLLFAWSAIRPKQRLLDEDGQGGVAGWFGPPERRARNISAFWFGLLIVWTIIEFTFALQGPREASPRIWPPAFSLLVLILAASAYRLRLRNPRGAAG
jgi:hypothetical protein